MLKDKQLEIACMQKKSVFVNSYMICYVQPQISSDADSPLVMNRKRLAALNTVRFFFIIINAVICCMAKLIQPS